MAAEAESIRKGCAHCAFLSLVEGEVEAVVDILIFVALFMVDCRGHDVFLYGLDREHGLEGAGSAEKVTGHRFGR